MTKSRCPGCDKTRDLREPCSHCGASPCGASPVAQGITFEEPTQPVADRRPPKPRDALQRFSPIVNNSPVFAEEPTNELPGGATADPLNQLNVSIEAKFEVASAPADSEPIVHCLLSITPDGPPLLDRTAGPVAHVILALDLSASMNHPDKYPVLTEALTGMLYELRSNNAAEVLVSIVVYAYGSEILFRQVSSKAIDPRDVLAAIDASPLRFGRYTDVVGALQRAGALAKSQLTANRAMPQRIYLLTDGKPQDMDGAHAIMAKLTKMPVDIDGLAFGADADVAALQQLVSGGRGGTVKQVRAETLSEAFGRIAEVAQRVVANRALLDIDLGPGIVGGEAYRFRPARHRYGESAFEGGTKFSRDLGSLESGRPYTLLFEVRLPRAKADTETEVGRVVLRLPGFGGPRTFEKHLAIPRHADNDVTIEPEVVAARDVLVALAGDDPQAMLRALRVRRGIYELERRDRHVLGVIDKAIAELEERGTLAALSASEHAALLSHTCTTSATKTAPARRRETSAR